MVVGSTGAGAGPAPTGRSRGRGVPRGSGGCEHLRPKPWVAWRKNPRGGWAASRIAVFPAGVGWVSFIYSFICLLTYFYLFSGSLIEAGGQGVLGKGKEEHRWPDSVLGTGRRMISALGNHIWPHLWGTVTFPIQITSLRTWLGIKQDGEEYRRAREEGNAVGLILILQHAYL